TDWQSVLAKVKRQKGVIAVGPFVHTQAVISAAKHKYFEAAFVEGIPPAGPGAPNVTSIREHATAGDFSFATLDGRHRGAVLGSRLAERLNVVPGVDSIRIFTMSSKISPITGMIQPRAETFEVTGIFNT